MGPATVTVTILTTIDNVWTPIRNFFPQYRAMFVRVRFEQPGGMTSPAPPALSEDLHHCWWSDHKASWQSNQDRSLEANTVQSCQYVITQGTDSDRAGVIQTSAITATSAIRLFRCLLTSGCAAPPTPG